MKEWVKEKLVEIIIAIAIMVIIVGCIGGAIHQHVENAKLWNNGYCECGGKWEYMESTQRIRGSKDGIYTYTGYIYKCDRCGRMHEFDEVR